MLLSFSLLTCRMEISTWFMAKCCSGGTVLALCKAGVLKAPGSPGGGGAGRISATQCDACSTRQIDFRCSVKQGGGKLMLFSSKRLQGSRPRSGVWGTGQPSWGVGLCLVFTADTVLFY